MSINRRKFVKKTIHAGGAFYFGMLPGCRGDDFQPTAIQANRSTVVEAVSPSIRDGNGKLIGDQVHRLLNNAMENLLQTTNAAHAWKKLFGKDDVVGIKINCLAGRGMSTHQELVEAIVEGLKSADLPERNIIIWDRSNRDLHKAGYQIKTGRNQLRCLGNDYSGYTREIYEFGAVGSSLSRILVDQCSAIINVPIVKDHGIVGITNALKNYFGAIHNPNKYHDNCGDPFIADVYMLPHIRKKNRLIISDLLTAQYEGGPPFMPQWSWDHNGILVGFDPVAMDTLAWTKIEQKRREHNLPTLKAAGREPTYIATAADEHHQLGTNNLKQIKLVKI
ncbi:MAG TPA: DUF362 domain-containing protein [bacterium]|nr:DUF362 domain-containing protein [bacterium]